MKHDLYRVASILTDGRKVYYSLRGRLHLMEGKKALDVAAMALRDSSNVSGDPGVFAMDLGSFGLRSEFLSRLRPFVMVKETTIEPARSPIDPGAYVLGGGSAETAGRYSRTRG